MGDYLMPGIPRNIAENPDMETVELIRAERTCHDEAESQQSFLCSVCGWFWNDQEDELGFSYCPNCGAKVVDE